VTLGVARGQRRGALAPQGPWLSRRSPEGENSQLATYKLPARARTPETPAPEQ